MQINIQSQKVDRFLLDGVWGVVMVEQDLEKLHRGTGKLLGVKNIFILLILMVVL